MKLLLGIADTKSRMAQSKQQIQANLAAASATPKHRLGQNFMIDQNLVRCVADAGGIQPGDLVIEVGPGTGTLSEEILARGGSLLAVEIDADLGRLLADRWTAEPHFQLIVGDALAGKHALHPELADAIARARGRGQTVKLVANLPYNIASPLVIELLLAGVDRLAFTVQREVGQRLRAAAGADDYGPISVMAQLLSRVEILRLLPSQAFWPQPKIESALVRMERADRLGPAAARMNRLIHHVFSARRKTLRNALLLHDYDARKLIERLGVDASIRPEVLTPEQFLLMHDSLDATAPPTLAPPKAS